VFTPESLNIGWSNTLWQDDRKAGAEDVHGETRASNGPSGLLNSNEKRQTVMRGR